MILEDGSTIRTEAPLCDNALRDTNWGWLATGSSSPAGEDLKFDLLVRIGTNDLEVDAPDKIQMTAAVDGKNRFKKEKQIETWTEPDVGEDVTGFLFQEKIPLKEGESLALQVFSPRGKLLLRKNLNSEEEE